MALRQKTPPPQGFIAFLGNAKIDQENAEALLDNFFDEGIDYTILLPDGIKRTSGLVTVGKVLDKFGLEYEQAPVQSVAAFAAKVPDNTDLILLLDPESDEADELAELAWNAHEAGSTIRNLCAAMDYVELADPEPEEPDEPKTYGVPRDGVTMEVDGPATINLDALTPPAVSLGDQLVDIIRTIVIQELGNLGIGHVAHVTTIAEKQQSVQAWVSDEDGDNPTYERVPDDKVGKRAPRGKRTVTLSAEEAEQVGI